MNTKILLVGHTAVNVASKTQPFSHLWREELKKGSKEYGSEFHMGEQRGSEPMVAIPMYRRKLSEHCWCDHGDEVGNEAREGRRVGAS